ncbi:SCO family protein [Comamonas flocculans]|nr:SCO family protein [Rhodanobacter sp.]
MAGGAMVALALAGCERSPPSYLAIDLTGADFGRTFALQDPGGRTRTLDEFKGRYVMLFFGFTQCPDVCPTALARAVEVRRLLGPDADKLQVLLVTVDPERETTEVLRSYTAAFDPGFIALRGDAQATEAVAREFKIHYARVPTGNAYTMDHTALTYILDVEGRLRLAVRHEQTPQEVAQDLRTLMKAAR